MIIFYIIFIFHSFSYISPLNNVAFKKPTYSSSIGQDSYPALAVDGNINGDFYAVLSRYETPKRYWFVIDLLYPYMVHHVQIYNRRCLDCTSALDYFFVGLSNNFRPDMNDFTAEDYSLCGQYPEKALAAGKPMKVVCEKNSTLSRYVVIKQDQSRIKQKLVMGFSEIEVYAEEFFGPNYVGCYDTFTSITEISLKGIKECLNYCNVFNTIFSAIKWGKCLCGNTLSWTIASEKCYVRCKRFTLCGSDVAFAVYMNRKPLIPRLASCFRDMIKQNSSVVKKTGRFNMFHCIEACSETPFQYAKIVNKDECICGRSVEFKEWKESNKEFILPCQRTCSKRPDKKCWDPTKIDVYLTCYDSILRMKCHEMYHCKMPLEANSTGFCPNHMCIDGWKGDLCNLRDCSKNNGNCGPKHICMETTLGLYTISECICSKGFYKKNVHERCKDIDECSTNLHNCKEPIYRCVNTFGGFECVVNEKIKNVITLKNKALLDCKNKSCPNPTQVCTRVYDEFFCHCASGYEYFNVSYCKDIDECAQSNRTCVMSSNCINTQGSYHCQCLEGYLSTEDNHCVEASKMVSTNGWNDEVFIVASSVFVAIFVVITGLLARVIYIQKRALNRIQMSLTLLTKQETINTPK